MKITRKVSESHTKNHSVFLRDPFGMPAGKIILRDEHIFCTTEKFRQVDANRPCGG